MSSNPLSDTGAASKITAFESLLQECVVCGVAVVDPKGTIAAMTPEAKHALLADDTSREIQTIHDLPESIRSIIRKVQTTGASIIDRPTAEGIVATAILVRAGMEEGAVVVTFKKIAPSQGIGSSLQRLDRLASVGLLSASMAHEIRNALVALKTFVDLLVEKNKDLELTDVVRREVNRVDAIIARMLNFASPSTPAFTEIHLHELLEHSLRLVKHRVSDKLVSFERHFNAVSDTLVADRHQLEQAFVNILFNAVEAMKGEGTLTVTTESRMDAAPVRDHDPTRQLRIRIADTGIGIPTDNLNQIFDPFFTTKSSGTGLGLAVTRRIVEDHKGTIQVESLPGKGSAFIIVLPAS
jgi:signal transduction histidine kinase